MLLRCERQQGSEVHTRKKWYVRLLLCGVLQRLLCVPNETGYRHDAYFVVSSLHYELHL